MWKSTQRFYAAPSDRLFVGDDPPGDHVLCTRLVVARRLAYRRARYCGFRQCSRQQYRQNPFVPLESGFQVTAFSGEVADGDDGARVCWRGSDHQRSPDPPVHYRASRSAGAGCPAKMNGQSGCAFWRCAYQLPGKPGSDISSQSTISRGVYTCCTNVAAAA